MKIKSLVLVIVLIAMTLLSGCGFIEMDENGKWEVGDGDKNSNNLPSTQQPNDPNCESNNTQPTPQPESTFVPLPQPPSPPVAGYVFGGWYADQNLTRLVSNANYNPELYPTLYDKWMDVSPREYFIRNSTATITDSGREHQQVDVVYMSNYLDKVGLQYAGYTKLNVILEIDAWEKDDGYQFIFIYNSRECADNGLEEDIHGDVYLHKIQFEHVAGRKSGDIEHYTFFFQIPLSSFGTELYVRYGASGILGDTWCNANLMLTIEPVKR